MSRYQIVVTDIIAQDTAAVFNMDGFNAFTYELSINDPSIITLGFKHSKDDINYEVFKNLNFIIDVRRKNNLFDKLHTVESYIIESYDVTYVEEEDVYVTIVTGSTLDSLLSRRMIFPEEDVLYGDTGYSIKSGFGHEILQELIEEQIGINASPQRRFPKLTVSVDDTTTNTAGGTYRYSDNLYDSLKVILKQVDLQLWGTHDGAAGIVMHIGRRGDHIPEFVISDLRGSVSELSAKVGAGDEVNFILGDKDKGEPANRLIYPMVISSRGTNPYTRREMYSMLKDGENNDTFLTQLRVKLLEKRFRVEQELSLSNSLSGSFIDDWNVGDTVSTYLNGVLEEVDILSAQVTYANGEEQITMETESSV